jgi:hypothetical protein
MLAIGSVGLQKGLLSLSNDNKKIVKLFIVQLTGTFGTTNYKLN